MTFNINNIQNSNGRFHVGMTLQEAKEEGVDKSTFRRDFHNLDKDKNGVLSLEEVMNERKRDANIEKWTALGWGACSILDLITTKDLVGKSIWLLIDALIIGMSAGNYIKIKQKDKEYQAMIEQSKSNLDVKM